MKTFYILLLISLSLRLFSDKIRHIQDGMVVKKKKTLFLVPTQESKNKHQFIQSSIFELLNNNKNSFVSLAIEAR